MAIQYMFGTIGWINDLDHGSNQYRASTGSRNFTWSSSATMAMDNICCIVNGRTYTISHQMDFQELTPRPYLIPSGYGNVA